MKVRAALVGLAFVLVAVAPALAHEEVSGVTNVIDAVEPALPGVTIQVQISVADQLLVENATTVELAVLGERDEPFLRIGPDGAFANLRSPTWYRSNDPTGAFPVPPSADASAQPQWVRIAREPSWGWFDHRLHRVQLGVAPPSDRPITLERWSVPMRYGDRDVVVRGRREFRPVRGAFTSEITKQIPGAEASILPGRLPGIFLRVTGSETVTLYSNDDQPFARVEPKGAEVNEASPTWALTASAKTGQPPKADVGPGVAPRWRKLTAAAQLAWLERRAQYPREEPPADVLEAGRTEVVRRWSVPARVGDERLAIEGTTSWVPSHAGAKTGSFPSAWVILSLAVLVLAGLLPYIWRRSKMRRS